MSELKTKKCKNKGCGAEFKQYNSIQKYCIPCGIEIGKKSVQKKNNKTVNKQKKELKSLDRKHQFKLTKTAVQKWVSKVRDKGQPCISCNTMKESIIYAGGHFKTAGGHAERALWSPNIHRQCNWNCNMNLSGNLNGDKNSEGYIVGIRKRYGQAYLDFIEVKRLFYRLTCEDLIKIRAGYNKLIRENDVDDSHIQKIILVKYEEPEILNEADILPPF